MLMLKMEGIWKNKIPAQHKNVSSSVHSKTKENARHSKGVSNGSACQRPNVARGQIVESICRLGRHALYLSQWCRHQSPKPVQMA